MWNSFRSSFRIFYQHAFSVCELGGGWVKAGHVTSGELTQVCMRGSTTVTTCRDLREA